MVLLLILCYTPTLKVEKIKVLFHFKKNNTIFQTVLKVLWRKQRHETRKQICGKVFVVFVVCFLLNILDLYIFLPVYLFFFGLFMFYAYYLLLSFYLPIYSHVYLFHISISSFGSRIFLLHLFKNWSPSICDDLRSRKNLTGSSPNYGPKLGMASTQWLPPLAK